MKHYKSVEFLSNFQCPAPLHKRKASLLKTFWPRFCYTDWMQPFEACMQPCITEMYICFALIVAGTIVALWRWLRNNEWEVLGELVYCFVTYVTKQWYHKLVLCAMESLLARVYGKKFRSFEIVLEWELSIGLEFKFNVLCKSIVSKNIQSNMNYILKTT